MSHESNGKSRTKKASRDQQSGSTSSPEVTIPNRKKRPGGGQPFTWFMKYCRDQLIKDNPNRKNISADFSTQCAQLWNKLPDEEKEPFRILSMRDRKRHDKESKNPDNESKKNVSSADKVKSTRRKRDPTLPKHPMGPFLWFAKEKRSLIHVDRPELNGTELSKELARLWTLLDTTGRSKFQAMSDDDKKRYKREKEVRALQKNQDTSPKLLFVLNDPK